MTRMTPAPTVRVGDRVDDDEAPGGPVGRVVVDEQRLGAAEGQAPDLVELQLGAASSRCRPLTSSR